MVLENDDAGIKKNDQYTIYLLPVLVNIDPQWVNAICYVFTVLEVWAIHFFIILSLLFGLSTENDAYNPLVLNVRTLTKLG